MIRTYTLQLSSFNFLGFLACQRGLLELGFLFSDIPTVLSGTTYHTEHVPWNVLEYALERTHPKIDRQ